MELIITKNSGDFTIIITQGTLICGKVNTANEKKKNTCCLLSIVIFAISIYLKDVGNEQNLTVADFEVSCLSSLW